MSILPPCLLPTELSLSGGLTISQCLSSCQAKGYIYLTGVEYTSQCYVRPCSFTWLTPVRFHPPHSFNERAFLRLLFPMHRILRKMRRYMADEYVLRYRTSHDYGSYLDSNTFSESGSLRLYVSRMRERWRCPRPYRVLLQ
jgi:hypothetical protein